MTHPPRIRAGWLALLALAVVGTAAGAVACLWLSAWLGYRIEQRFLFERLDAGTPVALALVLPRTGAYQRVGAADVSWSGSMELAADGPVDVLRLEGAADADGRIEAVVRYEVRLLDGSVNWEDVVPDSCRAPARFIESDDPKLVAVAAQLVSGTSREDAFRLHAFTADHVRWGELRTYERDGEQKTGAGEESALLTYDSRSGGCLEFANLTVALARAAQIPARTISGLALPEMQVFETRSTTWNHPAGAHAWIEFHTDDGWEQADPSWASGKPTEAAKRVHFGRNDGRHLSYGDAAEGEQRYAGLLAWARERGKLVGAMSAPLKFAAAVGAPGDSPADEAGDGAGAAFTPSATVTRTSGGRWTNLLTVLAIGGGVTIGLLVWGGVTWLARRRRASRTYLCRRGGGWGGGSG